MNRREIWITIANKVNISRITLLYANWDLKENEGYSEKVLKAYLEYLVPNSLAKYKTEILKNCNGNIMNLVNLVSNQLEKCYMNGEELIDLEKSEESVNITKKVVTHTENEKKKYLIRKEEFSSVNCETFRDKYFQCERCGAYDNQQCICYAR